MNQDEINKPTKLINLLVIEMLKVIYLDDSIFR